MNVFGKLQSYHSKLKYSHNLVVFVTFIYVAYLVDLKSLESCVLEVTS